jgi:excisionase family DNA binding protein
MCTHFYDSAFFHSVLVPVTCDNAFRMSRVVMAMDTYYTAPQVAKLLGLSHHTIRQYCFTGRIKAEKFGNQFTISLESIDAFKKLTGRDKK